MRVWLPWLFGVMLTVASGYIAQLAVASAGFERIAGLEHSVGAPAPEPLWYGGVLDPIIIQVSRPAALAALAARKQHVECGAPSAPKRMSISTEPARAQTGS
jgi:hypothetical protein